MAHSQRSAQWSPVHSWLESLDKSEVVKSKEISVWLSENPSVKELLYLRYSRYHLMHYIQKCHSRMLKRQGRGKYSNLTIPMKARENEENATAIRVPCNPSNNNTRENDIARRNEALHKYKVLTEFKDQLYIVLSRHEQMTNSGESFLVKQMDVDGTHNE